MNFTAHYSGSSGNLYTVEEDGRRLILECGVSMKKIREALNHGLPDYEDCLVSHGHQDHCRSARDLMRVGINIHCSPETATVLGNLSHRINIVYPGHKFLAGGFQVLPFATEHDAEGSLGFLIMSPASKLLFAMDTFYLRQKFTGLTHVAVECNYSKATLSPDLDPAVRRRLLSSHFSLEHVKEFIAANMGPALREIHLLHLSDGNSDAELFRLEIQKLTGKPCYV
jgi:phosphoribosyl 1,2-cyclic phosphodiesterase